MDFGHLNEIALQLGAAMLTGGVIGIQRAFRGKVAGVRTHILICVGAALFTQISHSMTFWGHTGADPTRIASQVVVGCGFIGAGTIMRSGFSVAGITSAATIWVVAALGCAAGSGLYEILLAGTVASLATLYLLGLLPISALRSFATLTIQFRSEATVDSYRTILAERKLPFRFVGFTRGEDGSITVDLLLRIQGDRMQQLELQLFKDKDILRVSGTPHS